MFYITITTHTHMYNITEGAYENALSGAILNFIILYFLLKNAREKSFMEHLMRGSHGSQHRFLSYFWLITP